MKISSVFDENSSQTLQEIIEQFLILYYNQKIVENNEEN